MAQLLFDAFPDGKPVSVFFGIPPAGAPPPAKYLARSAAPYTPIAPSQTSFKATSPTIAYIKG